MTAISLSASLIQRYAQQVPSSGVTSKIHKQVNTINQQVLSLTELISDTLTLGKIEAGKVSVELAATDLVERSLEVMGLFGNRDDGRHVELAVRGKSTKVVADKKLLRHVLANLLSNAFKFSSSNPELTLVYGSQQTRIRVSDRG